MFINLFQRKVQPKSKICNRWLDLSAQSQVKPAARPIEGTQ